MTKIAESVETQGKTGNIEFQKQAKKGAFWGQKSDVRPHFRPHFEKTEKV